MVGSRTEPEQVLELLKAAAGELKTAQSELEAERSKNKQLLAQIDRLESQLKATPQAMTDVRSGLVITVPSNVRAAVEEKTGVVVLEGDLAETRIRGLEEELERAKNAEQAVREKLADVEADYAEAMTALTKLRNGVSTAEESTRVVKLAQQLNAMSKELAAARAELSAQATTGTLAIPTGQGAPSASAEAAAELAKRISQLEGELAQLRARRDDLNVELARVDNDRKLARTRIAELEVEAAKAREQVEAELKSAVAAEVAKRADAESAREKEREKHQATAQKLIEARTRIRELEGSGAQLTMRITELELQVSKAAEAAKQALAAKEAAWAQNMAGLETRAADAENKLESATAELRHVERTYEQLHREMLTLLDQRDEARRELTVIKTRLGIST